MKGFLYLVSLVLAIAVLYPRSNGEPVPWDDGYYTPVLSGYEPVVAETAYGKRVDVVKEQKDVEYGVRVRDGYGPVYGPTYTDYAGVPGRY